MPTLVDREVACWSVIAVGTGAAVIAVVAAGGIIPALAGPVSANHLEKPGPNMVPATHEAPAAVQTEPEARRWARRSSIPCRTKSWRLRVAGESWRAYGTRLRRDVVATPDGTPASPRAETARMRYSCNWRSFTEMERKRNARMCLPGDSAQLAVIPPDVGPPWTSSGSA